MSKSNSMATLMFIIGADAPYGISTTVCVRNLPAQRKRHEVKSSNRSELGDALTAS